VDSDNTGLGTIIHGSYFSIEPAVSCMQMAPKYHGLTCNSYTQIAPRYHSLTCSQLHTNSTTVS
jgi:hypothetical protein